jgi:cold shock CspA family protein
MTKTTSSSKRDNEKKKLSKRLEKQQRKEKRKSNTKGGSLDEMLAYVDENGVITSTPPDTEKKKELIDVESIAISTPRREETREPEVVHTGKVDFFNSSKGFGFIKDKEKANNYFFHKSNAAEGISEGDMVVFDLEQGPRGLNAVNVRPAE